MRRHQAASSRLSLPENIPVVAKDHIRVTGMTLEGLVSQVVAVHDLLMSENIQNNLFLSGRTFPVGRFHFIELAGPPLGPGMGMEAVEFLRNRGMEFTPEGVRRDAHKFGWLWCWIDEWQAKWMPPHLCNTDGDDLLWHTASFSVANPLDVRRALLQRQDVEYDDLLMSSLWFRLVRVRCNAISI
ncbi:MAG TPA: hypothetical protein VMW72_25755 [Sedimentisphaerales bacterium]|nr:hypothetical protein [Sedimentisphaerales bacterium]